MLSAHYYVILDYRDKQYFECINIETNNCHWCDNLEFCAKFEKLETAEQYRVKILQTHMYDLRIIQVNLKEI